MDVRLDRKVAQIERMCEVMEAAVAQFKARPHRHMSDGSSASAIYRLAEELQGALSCMIEAVGGEADLEDVLTEKINAVLQPVWDAEYAGVPEYPAFDRDCNAADRIYQAVKEGGM